MLQKMGNKKSKHKPITNYEYYADIEARRENLVDPEFDNDFNEKFIEGYSFRITRVEFYIGNDVWFYYPIHLPGRYSSDNFKRGELEKFDYTNLTADIRVGSEYRGGEYYRVPLWKIFMKVYNPEEPPTKQQWNKRLEAVGDAASGMDIAKNPNNLKF